MPQHNVYSRISSRVGGPGTKPQQGGLWRSASTCDVTRVRARSHSLRVPGAHRRLLMNARGHPQEADLSCQNMFLFAPKVDDELPSACLACHQPQTDTVTGWWGLGPPAHSGHAHRMGRMRGAACSWLWVKVTATNATKIILRPRLLIWGRLVIQRIECLAR